MLVFTGFRTPQLAKPAFAALVVVLAVAAGVLGALLVGAVSG